MNLPNQLPHRVNWRAVAVFYLIACSISWPLFWWRDVHPDSWQHWALPGALKGWLPALGPLFGCLAVLAIFRGTHQRTISVPGTSFLSSAATAAIPLLVFAAVGAGDDHSHRAAVQLGIVFLVYSLGEEAGWRGFLHDALQPLGELRRAVLIGFLWGTWHFTTFVSGGLAASARRLAVMYCVWIAASWIMGRAATVSRSLTVAAALHLIFIFALGFPPRIWIPVLGISIPCWAYLLYRWPRSRVER